MQTWQISDKTARSNIGSTNNEELDNVLTLVDDKLSSPLKASINSNTITISASVKQNLESDGADGTQSSFKERLPVIGGLDYSTITSSTIDLTSGITTGVFASNPAVTANYYIQMGIVLRSDKKLYVIWGTEASSLGSTTVPNFTGDDVQILVLKLKNSGTTGTWLFNTPVKTDLEVIDISFSSAVHAQLTSTHGVSGSIVGTAGSQTITDKKLSDSTTSIVDVSDPTIAIKFDAAGTTGTTTTLLSSQTTNKILTLPNATDTLVARETAEELKNKTIDGDLNTVQDLPLTSIKTVVGEAGKVVQYNGSGVPSASKTLSGMSVQVPTQLDVKQDTKANLTTYATTASNGQIVFATDTKEYLAVKDSALVSMGGGGLTPTNITTTPTTISSNSEIVANVSGSTAVLTLPTTLTIGDVINVTGIGSDSWKIQSNSSASSQKIVDLTTSSAVSSNSTIPLWNSTGIYNSISLVAVASDTLAVKSKNGGEINFGITLPSQVKGYWRMDETSGNALDLTGNFNATQVGTISSSTGKLANARGQFTDSNYFSIANNSIFNASLFGLSGWLYIPTMTGRNTIWSHGIYAGNSKRDFVVSGTQIFWYFNQNDGYVQANGITAGAWHHFFTAMRATSGTNEVRIYVDGTLAGQNTGISVGSYSGVSVIGTTPTYAGDALSSYYFRGLIDDLAYWDLTGTPYTWTQLESYVSQLYDAGAGKRFTI
jgi:hypothetical protein